MALPEEFLQELRARSDITEVASQYVSLKRRGRNMVGLCPFHGEKTPSFNIYTETNSFYCFGCGAGGDVITFVMRIENLDYIEAVRLLAQRAGMSMPSENYDDSLAKLKRRIYEANRETARFFFRTLYSPIGRSGLEYLRSRGLSDKTIRHFGLGFAPDSRFDLSNHLRQKGFTDEELVAANLAYKNKNGRGTNDRFYNRVMFPIIDVRGNVIAFGGRIMTDEKPKYLNTSDTLVFNKSQNLFSLNNAKKTTDRTLILCEGYMDVIAVNQAGFENAVATLGTSLTSEQAVLMKRFADEVIICYDADEAGQKATRRAISILRKAGLEVRVLVVPDGKDPDEFIRKNGDNGGAAFYSLINASTNDIEYKLNKLKRNYDLSLPDQRVRFLNEASGVLAELEKPLEQETYASRLSEELGVSRESIMQEVTRLKRSRARGEKKKEFSRLAGSLAGRDDRLTPHRREELRASRAEENLLSVLINYPEEYSYISSHITADSFVTDFNRRLYRYFASKLDNGSQVLNTVSGDFSQAEINRIFSIANISRGISPSAEAIDEYIRVLSEEKDKLSAEQIANASTQTLSDYISKLKSKRE